MGLFFRSCILKYCLCPKQPVISTKCIYKMHPTASCAPAFNTVLAVRSEIRRSNVWNVFPTWLEAERFLWHYKKWQLSNPAVGVEWIGKWKLRSETKLVQLHAGLIVHQRTGQANSHKRPKLRPNVVFIYLSKQIFSLTQFSKLKLPDWSDFDF